MLEENCDAIKQEYIQVSESNGEIDVTIFSEEQKKSVDENQWSVFPFRIFGKIIEKNTARCPVTARCLEQIPDCTTAWFSIMKPNTNVKLHRGVYNGYLRCLLGIIVPKDITQSALCINNKTYHWKAGECVIFDDTYMHSAYNHNNEPRVVLYLDFIRPMPLFLVFITRKLTTLFANSAYVKNMKY